MQDKQGPLLSSPLDGVGDITFNTCWTKPAILKDNPENYKPLLKPEALNALIAQRGLQIPDPDLPCVFQ